MPLFKCAIKANSYFPHLRLLSPLQTVMAVMPSLRRLPRTYTVQSDTTNKRELVVVVMFCSVHARNVSLYVSPNVVQIETCAYSSEKAEGKNELVLVCHEHANK